MSVYESFPSSWGGAHPNLFLPNDDSNERSYKITLNAYQATKNVCKNHTQKTLRNAFNRNVSLLGRALQLFPKTCLDGGDGDWNRKMNALILGRFFLHLLTIAGEKKAARKASATIGTVLSFPNATGGELLGPGWKLKPNMHHTSSPSSSSNGQQTGAYDECAYTRYTIVLFSFLSLSLSLSFFNVLCSGLCKTSFGDALKCIAFNLLSKLSNDAGNDCPTGEGEVCGRRNKKVRQKVKRKKFCTIGFQGCEDRMDELVPCVCVCFCVINVSAIYTCIRASMLPMPHKASPVWLRPKANGQSAGMLAKKLLLL